MKHCIKTLINAFTILILIISLSSCSQVNKNYFFKDKSKDISVNDNNLSIVFIDVGQADSILVMDSGHSMLIDGGNTDDGSLVCDEIKSHQIECLDYVVNTHAHEDHCGGLTDVINSIPVDNAIISPKESDSECYTNFKSSLASNNVSTYTATVGQTFCIGNATAEIIGPYDETKNDENINNTSVIIRLTAYNKTFLFMGDAENEEERSLVQNGANLKCDLIKAGHHGSSTSSGYALLKNAMPTYSIISVGENNDYGHPDNATLSRYSDVDATLYRTDLCGTITATANKNKDISINSKK